MQIRQLLLKQVHAKLEGTINGLGERAGNVAIEEVVMALKTRHDYFGDLEVNIDTNNSLNCLNL